MEYTHLYHYGITYLVRLSHLQIYVLLSFMYHPSSCILISSMFIGVHFCISCSYFVLPSLYMMQNLLYIKQIIKISLKVADSAVHKVTTQTSIASTLTSTQCYRCGRSNHVPNECRCHEAVCHYCNKKGHIAPACRAKKQQGAACKQVNEKGPFYRKAHSTHFASTEDQTQAHATMSIGDKNYRSMLSVIKHRHFATKFSSTTSKYLWKLMLELQFPSCRRSSRSSYFQMLS